MENLEEVLQALDEFQKMRPTVIPQELEDYLCWVAKTGDPIYQWSLIKTLFREKLTRVMTDFYESCPTLELAPCPNVEHFNYDTMKSNLLERLESFANAPFTVQRICELLTAPRKEYNRVDKFMRAIEKNILVVSTREPGPIARRGETGDGMVNGSVEEDTASITQQQQQPPPPPSPSPSLSPSQPPLQPQTTQSAQPNSQDVDMEYWEKDCSSTVTINVHTVENEPALMHNVISNAAASMTKAVFNADESNREKLEPTPPRTETATSNFISTTSDFSTISNLTPQVQSHESAVPVPAVPVVQSLTENVGMITEDSSVGANDAVTIMNQDISSQSSLNLENEENETVTTATTTTTTMTVATTAATTTTVAAAATTTTTAAASTTSTTSTATTTVTVVATVIPLTTDTTRKLQAAFQAKRFDSGDSKCSEKSEEKVPASPTTIGVEEEIGHSMKNGETSTESSSGCMDSNEISHNESRLNENSLQTDVEMKSDVLAASTKNVTEERTSNESQEGGTALLEDVDEENLRCSKSENAKATFVESRSMEKDSVVMPDECVSAVIVSSSDALYRTEKTEIHSTGTISATISSKESFVHEQSVSQETESMDVADEVLEAVPRVVSSKSDDEKQKAQDSESNMDNLKIEITNGKTSVIESTASDSISVQTPKEPTSVIEKLDSSISSIVEMTGNVDNVSCQSPKSDKLINLQDDSLANIQGDKATECITIKTNQPTVIENVCRKEPKSDLMEVDDEEALSTFQQDEQMEHETMEELSKS